MFDRFNRYVETFPIPILKFEDLRACAPLHGKRRTALSP